MGLDIRVIRIEESKSNDEFRGLSDKESDKAWDNGWTPLTVVFDHGTDGLTGWVNGESLYSFRAGSYSGYNAWRRWLATVAGATVEEMWEEEADMSLLFWSLINNSDAEGFIGPKTCAKLHKQFAENREFAAKTVEAEEQLVSGYGYFMECYDNWTQATALAGDSNGVLILC